MCFRASITGGASKRIAAVVTSLRQSCLVTARSATNRRWFTWLRPRCDFTRHLRRWRKRTRLTWRFISLTSTKIGVGKCGWCGESASTRELAMNSVRGAIATGSQSTQRSGSPEDNPVAIAPGTDSVLVIDSGRLSSQPSINPRQTLRQRKHVVDDRVTDLAVEIAQLALRFAIDGDAERRDSLRLGLAQSFARVFASITGITIVVIIRSPVGQNDQQTRAGFLLLELRRGMTNRRAQTRVVLISNATDAPHHFICIMFAEI